MSVFASFDITQQWYSWPMNASVLVFSNKRCVTMAPKRDRRRVAPAAPASAWALQWYEQLPEGHCRRFVDLVRDSRRRAGATDGDALMESFAYAQQYYPEEVVLWTLNGGVVPDPWHNESVQAGVRSSLLALRQLREDPLLVLRELREARAEAALAEVPVQHAAAVVPFSGVGHRLN